MNEKAEAPKRDRVVAREELANKLIALAEDGQVSWQRSWRLMSKHMPFNAISGRSYSGGNHVNLRLSTMVGAGWSSPGWLTLRQIKDAGGSLREGIDRSPHAVEFWRTTEFWERRQTGLIVFIDGRLGRVLKMDHRDVEIRHDGAAESMRVPISEADSRIAVRHNLPGFNGKRLSFSDARREFSSLSCVNYLVYNLEQCQGIDRDALHKRLRVEPPADAQDADSVLLSERVDALIAGMEASGLKVVHTPSNQPRYSILADTVFMPERGQFKRVGSYVAILAHELAHASGAGHRLARFVGGIWGGESDVEENSVNASRAKEELIAEMASAMVCAEIGADYEMTATAGYLQAWIGELKSGSSVAYSAAKDAQSAAEFLINAMESQMALRAKAAVEAGASSAPQPSAEAEEESNFAVGF
jgi:antirestriction protein ArdC